MSQPEPSRDETRLDAIAYKLGFGARRRAELARGYQMQQEHAYLWRPPPAPRRRGRRSRVYVRGGVGCIGCSVPLLVALAALAALTAWLS